MFKKNCALLNNQELRTRLENISIEDSKKDMSYCMTPSNDYLIMKKDVPFDDIQDPRGAIKETLRSVIKNPMQRNDIIITFGIGLCYMLDEVFNAYPSKIFIYEPDIEVLHFVLHNVDISEHLASGRVYITDRLDELVKKLAEVYINNDKVEIVYLKNYAIVKSKELLELTQSVYETCRGKMVDVNTITRYSKRWLNDVLKNLSIIKSKTATAPVCKLSDLEDKFSGQTALIIAAGPSLMDNIDFIKANREKFVIFAVNKTLRILEANNLIPDFVVCLDAARVDSTLSGLEDFCSKTSCIMDIRADSVLFEKKFKKFFVSFPQNDNVVKNLAQHNDLKLYEIGGTATSFALVSALKLGFNRIVFTGLDLAFKNDVLYSTGEKIQQVSAEKIAIDNTEKRIVKVPSVTGEMVRTRDDYATFIKHFEYIMQDVKGQEVFNTTSFGAKIKGMKNMDMQMVPLLFVAMGTPFILGEVKPMELKTEDWSSEELVLINNVINILSKNVYSSVLVSAVLKSPLLYQYMQAEILKVIQSNINPSYAEEFMAILKSSIKELIDSLQKYRLI